MQEINPWAFILEKNTRSPCWSHEQSAHFSLNHAAQTECLGYLIKVLCCFIKAQSLLISILIHWQNITLETFMLGYKFYISSVGKRERSDFGNRRIRTQVERIQSYFQAPHALRPMPLQIYSSGRIFAKKDRHLVQIYAPLSEM